MKKLLALVLALVMVMGLSVTANAATYSDDADISKDEAVDVMSALKVFDGIDGAFQPTGTLTREMGAKIIASMIIGKTAADALGNQATKFTDVAADRWSAGSIAFCTNEGIIGGVGDNKFDPTGTLTGYAFAKMALVALGYDPEVEGLVGSDWQVNTAKLATAAGLTDSLGELVMSGPISREQACQMALNTEVADMVSYTGGVTVGDVKVGSTREKVENKSTTNRYDGAADDTMQFCERYASTLKYSAGTTDDYGRPADKWTLAGVVVSKEATETATATFTTKLQDAAGKKTIQDTLGDYIIPNGGAVNGTTYAAIKATVNGDKTSAANFDSLTDTTDDSDLAYLTGTGRLVEVYTNGDGVITNIVVLDTYLAKVTSKDTSNKTVSLTVYDAGTPKTSIIKSAATDTNADFYEQLYAMDKGDYVLLYASNVAANSLAILDIIGTPKTDSGKYTAYTSSSVTVNGTAYKTANKGSAAAVATLGKSYDLCLDTYGNILMAAEAESTTSYAYLLGLTTEGSIKNDNVTYFARLLTAEGDAGWVELSQVNSSKNASELSANYSALNTAYANAYDRYVSYSKKDDGTYSVTKVTNQAYTGTTTIGTTYSNSAAISVTGGEDLEKNDNTISAVSNTSNTFTLTNNTVFLFKGADGTWTAYKGLSNLPASTNLGRYYALYEETGSAANGDIAKMIVADTLGASTTTTNIFVYDNAPTKVGAASDNVQVETVKAIVDGVITTVDVKATLMDGDGNDTADAGAFVVQGLYNKTVKYKNGYVDAAALAVSNTNTTKITNGNNVTTVHTGGAHKGSTWVYDLTVTDEKVYLSNGILYTTGAVGSTTLVGDDFKFFVMDTGSKSATEVTLPTTSAGARQMAADEILYIVVDGNGYAQYAVLQTTVLGYANSAAEVAIQATAAPGGGGTAGDGGSKTSYASAISTGLSLSVDGTTIKVSGKLTALDFTNDAAAITWFSGGTPQANLAAFNTAHGSGTAFTGTKIAFIALTVQGDTQVIVVGENTTNDVVFRTGASAKSRTITFDSVGYTVDITGLSF